VDLRYALHTTIVLAALGVACGGGDAVGPTDKPAAITSGVLKTLEVASSRVECTGVTTQTCLQVRESSDAQWTLLYDAIVGFAYEPGFVYRIRVKEEAVANPPADASSLRRTLVEVLSRTAAPASLVGPTWRLVSIDGREAVPGVRVTATFAADDRIAGTAGCNRYTGRAAADGARLDVGLLASTRMFCGAAGVMDQESAYLAALEKVRSYRIAGTTLELGPAPGRTSLLFKLE
jgi:heat shock protein HslJ